MQWIEGQGIQRGPPVVLTVQWIEGQGIHHMPMRVCSDFVREETHLQLSQLRTFVQGTAMCLNDRTHAVSDARATLSVLAHILIF